MNRVPRARVKSFRRAAYDIAQDIEKYGVMGVRSLAQEDELTIVAICDRLLALEDALKEAGPVIKQYARQLSEDHDGNYAWLKWRDDAVKALEALAALGGDT